MSTLDKVYQDIMEDEAKQRLDESKKMKKEEDDSDDDDDAKSSDVEVKDADEKDVDESKKSKKKMKNEEADKDSDKKDDEKDGKKDKEELEEDAKIIPSASEIQKKSDTQDEMIRKATELMKQMGADKLVRTITSMEKDVSGEVNNPVHEEVDVKAEMAGVFEGLEIDAKQKEALETLFEAAIADKARKIYTELDEKYQAKLEETEATLTEAIDQYLDTLGDKWLEENRIAVEHGVSAELTESFLSNLKTLFEDHYVSVPEGKEDLFAKALEENEELEAKYTDMVFENKKLSESVKAFTKSKIVNDLSEGLTMTEKERLAELSESVDFTDDETFSRKIEVLKENFLNTKTPSQDDGEMLNEEAESEETLNEGVSDPEIDALANALGRQAKYYK